LTKLLNAQGLQDPSAVEATRLSTPSTGVDEPSDGQVPVAFQKKRKLETSVYEREGEREIKIHETFSFRGDRKFLLRFDLSW
jgi:hypothetical protein